ncbi:MAG: hypothetical protein Q4D21_06175 [Phascolarctobacterium sp.]|nr:hypothetical protein [Phascolarctobacterium sp.]
MSKKFRDALWQRIILQKIENQADALRLMNKPGSEEIRKYLLNVESRDRKNCEALAAKNYFQYYYYPGLNRRDFGRD